MPAPDGQPLLRRALDKFLQQDDVPADLPVELVQKASYCPTRNALTIPRKDSKPRCLYSYKPSLSIPSEVVGFGDNVGEIAVEPLHWVDRVLFPDARLSVPGSNSARDGRTSSTNFWKVENDATRVLSLEHVPEPLEARTRQGSNIYIYINK